MSLEGGSGETCFQRFPPKPNPIMQNRKPGLEGGLRITHFHPPDCGGANHDNRYDGSNAPPLASERSERARWGESEVPEE